VRGTGVVRQQIFGSVAKWLRQRIANPPSSVRLRPEPLSFPLCRPVPTGAKSCRARGLGAAAAVGVVLSGEKVRLEDSLAAPDPTEVVSFGAYRVLALESRVRMKLTANRRKDQGGGKPRSATIRLFVILDEASRSWTTDVHCN
jgi:hypothetical protein